MSDSVQNGFLFYNSPVFKQIHMAPSPPATPSTASSIGMGRKRSASELRKDDVFSKLSKLDLSSDTSESASENSSRPTSTWSQDIIDASPVDEIIDSRSVLVQDRKRSPDYVRCIPDLEEVAAIICTRLYKAAAAHLKAKVSEKGAGRITFG
jgi:hypothetical protein